MSDVTIEDGAKVEYSIIDEKVVVGKNAKIGETKEKQKGITVLGRNITIGKNVNVEGGKIIDSDLTEEEK